MNRAWAPQDVVILDLLAHDAPPDTVWSATAKRVVVSIHGRPLSVVDVAASVASTRTECLQVLREQFADELAEHRATYECDVLAYEDVPAAVCLRRRRALLSDAPSISVLVATHDRPDLLARCLESMFDQVHQPLEIVVVDNARSSDATEQLLQRPDFLSRGVRYVRDDVPGLGRAHNTGLAAARGDIVAITDDDVVADRFWLAGLVEAFLEHDAGCVTGMIVPLELRTREQSLVEEYGGFGRGFHTRVYSLSDPPVDDPLFPFTAGRLGSGANMAFRRRLLSRIGGFDSALGAGTRAQGGDDLAAFARTALAGERLVYHPDALVRHQHHDNYAALERMAHGYGVGLGAYLTSLVVNDPRLLAAMLRRLPAGVSHLLRADSPKNRNITSDYPRALVRAERRGLLLGPWRYVESLRAVRKAPAPELPGDVPAAASARHP